MKLKSARRFIGPLCLVITILISTRSFAQNATYFEVMRDLKRIQQNFLIDSGQYVACTMTYLYSMESTPLKYIDSLQGQYKSAGRIKYVRIAHTETIQNDSMIMTIYNDDKVIVAVRKPVSSFVHMGEGLMLNNMDSAFIAGNADSITIKLSGNQKIMNFRFNPSSQYYNCTLIYNASTYVPISLAYILRQTKLSESGKPPSDGNLITIKFSGYNQAAFDASSLNINKYIQVDSKGSAVAQTAFSSFNIVQR
jgi:hypothetical protein